MRSVPNILVYRNRLLPYSETFILSQMEGLKSFRPFYLGASPWREGPSLKTPVERTRFINTGKDILRESLFKLSDWVPPDVLSWARNLRFALVHAHFAPDGLVALSIAKALRLPLVVSLHGSDLTTKDAWVWRKKGSWLHKLYTLRRGKLLKEAAAFIVPSRYMWELALKKGFPKEKLYLVPHGVPLEAFEYQEAHYEPYHIVYVGRLISLKGLPYLIEALAKLQPRFPELTLTVIGGGPEEHHFKKLAWERLGGAARFLGPQPPEVVREYLKKAHLFSMPSVTQPSGQTEAFGLVYVEAQAMGVPVVAFAVGGVPEVVEHGETGFLAQAGNTEELSQYIAVLFEDPKLREKMSIAARRRVETLFDLNKNVGALEKVYQQITSV